MKKIILSMLAVIVTATFAHAQSIIVYGTDGTKTKFEASKVKKLSSLKQKFACGVNISSCSFQHVMQYNYPTCGRCWGRSVRPVCP